jgi:hypothetical protein
VFYATPHQVKESLAIEVDDFPSNEVYPEQQIGKMGKSAMKVLSMKDEEFYEVRRMCSAVQCSAVQCCVQGMGKYFVQLAKDVGYEKTILMLGRRMRCLPKSVAYLFASNEAVMSSYGFLRVLGVSVCQHDLI